MGFMYEFPHTSNFDSDLREILEKYNLLKDIPEEFKKLQDFIENYFNNLNVTDEINSKIENMLSNGELDNIIPTIKKKQVILIADSYGTHYDFMDMFRNATNFADLYPYTYSGGGFYGNGSAITFIEALSNVGRNITSKDSITDIIVIGGFNDATDMINNNRSVSDLANKVAEFLIECATTYPNAIVHIGMVGWCTEINNGATYRRILKKSITQAYRDGNYIAGKNNATYIENIEYSIHGFDCVDNTNYHPNANGNKNIIKGIINSLYGGSCNYWFSGNCDVSVIESLDVTESPTITITQILDNNIASIFSGGIAFNKNITFNTPITVKAQSIYLLKLDSYIALPFSLQYGNGDVYYVDASDNQTKQLDAVLFITNDGRIGFSRKHPNNDAIQIKAINIGAINFQFSTT